jgi:mRNA interferase MazF
MVLCQITSQATRDRYSVSLEAEDFSEGRLSQSSSIRPNRLFTADGVIILYKAGSVLTRKLNQAIERVIEILRA